MRLHRCHCDGRGQDGIGTRSEPGQAQGGIGSGWGQDGVRAGQYWVLADWGWAWAPSRDKTGVRPRAEWGQGGFRMGARTTSGAGQDGTGTGPGRGQDGTRTAPGRGRYRVRLGKHGARTGSGQAQNGTRTEGASGRSPFTRRGRRTGAGGRLVTGVTRLRTRLD